MKDLLQQLLWKTLGYGVVPTIILWNGDHSPKTWLITLLIVLVVSSLTTYYSLLDKKEEKYKKDIFAIQQKAQAEVTEATKLKERAVVEQEIWKQTMLERNAGFKTLLSYISYFEKLRDEPITHYLHTKKHPAPSAGEVVKEQTKRRREADFLNKRT
ncbi:MAG: hypothetical protein WAX85_01275 [Minisyncoccia bacterium]